MLYSTRKNERDFGLRFKLRIRCASKQYSGSGILLTYRDPGGQSKTPATEGERRLTLLSEPGEELPPWGKLHAQEDLLLHLDHLVQPAKTKPGLRENCVHRSFLPGKRHGSRINK
jgi:hypothetical protein